MRIVNQGVDMLSHIGHEIYAAKAMVEHSIGFSNDALHVISGVLLHLIAAFVLRSSLRNFGPWLMVFGLALTNEVNDLHIKGTGNLYASGKDIILLLLVPSLLLLVARTRPNLLARRG